MITSSTAQAALQEKCGENLTWTLDSSGAFAVLGEGPMHTYDFDWDIYGDPLVPWCNARSNIKIVIKDDIASISQYAFYNYSASGEYFL